jgi:YesN/AraC family two-component response regulator
MEQVQTKAYSLQHKAMVDKALDYLKQNYNSEIKLDDLAIKSFVSKNYFSKLFKEVTGINFSDYIQKLRIDEACSLLRNTDSKISDIANQVGIKDMKFFYEIFKRITGETPGDYRKS